MGCYLCRPDDPNAADEACDDCDREFWANPVAILLDDWTRRTEWRLNQPTKA